MTDRGSGGVRGQQPLEPRRSAPRWAPGDGFQCTGSGVLSFPSPQFLLPGYFLPPCPSVGSRSAPAPFPAGRKERAGPPSAGAPAAPVRSREPTRTPPVPGRACSGAAGASRGEVFGASRGRACAACDRRVTAEPSGWRKSLPSGCSGSVLAEQTARISRKKVMNFPAEQLRSGRKCR